MPILPEEEPVAGATVLEEIPGRTLTFLRGIAHNPVIHSQLAKAGFTSDDYQQGWALLHDASGYTPAPAPAPEKTPAFLAMQALDDWDEDGFRLVRAPLEHMHPAQCDFVFAGGLAASAGAQSVIGVKMLLDRLDELENGKDRKATRKEDHAALESLARRGITKAERERLRALVDTAHTLGDAAPLPSKSSDDQRQQALIKLYAWYKDWSNTARAVIKKRAHLITLGLAKRRPSKKTAEPAKAEPTKAEPTKAAPAKAAPAKPEG